MLMGDEKIYSDTDLLNFDISERLFPSASVVLIPLESAFTSASEHHYAHHPAWSYSIAKIGFSQ